MNTDAIDQVLDFFGPDGEFWNKGQAYGWWERNGKTPCCLFIAIDDPIVAKIVAEVVREQYPDRCGDSRSWPIAPFNDHPDTTFDDIRLVCEKAKIALEEGHVPQSLEPEAPF